MGERVTFQWSHWDETEMKRVPNTEAGEVIHWLVVPDEEATGPYGEGRPVTYYNPSAIVKADDGGFKVVRVEQLTQEPREAVEGPRA